MSLNVETHAWGVSKILKRSFSTRWWSHTITNNLNFFGRFLASPASSSSINQSLQSTSQDIRSVIGSEQAEILFCLCSRKTAFTQSYEIDAHLHRNDIEQCIININAVRRRRCGIVATVTLNFKTTNFQLVLEMMKYTEIKPVTFMIDFLTPQGLV